MSTESATFSTVISEYIQNFCPCQRLFSTSHAWARRRPHQSCIALGPNLAFFIVARDFPGMLFPSCAALGTCSLVHCIADCASRFAYAVCPILKPPVRAWQGGSWWILIGWRFRRRATRWPVRRRMRWVESWGGLESRSKLTGIKLFPSHCTRVAQDSGAQ